MPAQIATLCKCFLTELTREGSHTSVLSKVVSEIATFFEHAATARILAFEEKFHPLSIWILDTYGLMPLFWDSLKCFMLIPT
jgi:hypothetical protein